MAFQRAKWHSNLTYRQTCRECKTIVEYKDDVLDFRPWYADGFVYCPKCKTSLRHSETYAIDAPANANAETVQRESGDKPSFCSNCGNRFGENDMFCGNCGKKR